MKKLLILLGLCGTLVACGNSELESMKKELEEVRSENLELKAFLGSENGPNYSMEDIEKISKGEEVAWKDGASDYDKVRDSVMNDKKNPATPDTTYDDVLLPQDPDTELQVSDDELIDPYSDEGAEIMWTRYKENNYIAYAVIDTNIPVKGISGYTIVPSTNVKNGTKVIIRFSK